MVVKLVVVVVVVVVVVAVAGEVLLKQRALLFCVFIVMTFSDCSHYNTVRTVHMSCVIPERRLPKHLPSC